MKYLHYEFNIGSEDAIKVTLDKQANVLLLDSSNYSNYKNGTSYKYYGGLAKVSPTKLSPPYGGHWHLVIDLEGYTGSVTASVNIIKK
jgi:hypothetical protein